MNNQGNPFQEDRTRPGGAIWQIIDCSGSPREMGRSYGEACRRAIQFAFELWQPVLKSQPRSAGFAANARKVLQRYAPAAAGELSGIAEGAGVDEDFILTINFRDTLADNAGRCTPCFLRESDVGPVVAKNNDAPPGELFPFVVRRGRPEHGLPFIQLTYAGWISGLDMLNGAGVANTHCSVGSRFPGPIDGLDVRLLLYELMQQCTRTGELCQKLKEIPLSGKGFAIALGDAGGDCRFIDAAVPQLGFRAGEENFAFATNLYMTPELRNADLRPPEKRKLCLDRYAYLATKTPPADLAGIKTLLADHSEYCAPCRHGGAAGSISSWSMILLPEKREALIADGNPCENPYHKLTLSC